MKSTIKKIKTEVKYSPENVSVNEVYIRPYTRSEMKLFSDVIKKSIRAYDVQMIKNCDVRLKCIEFFARQKFENMNMFWILYMQKADILLNSRRFVIEAKRLYQNPTTLATNIVAHGATEVKKVATYGIAGSRINLDDYQCQIVPDDVIKRFMENPEEFYQKAEPNVPKIEMVNVDEQPAA